MIRNIFLIILFLSAELFFAQESDWFPPSIPPTSNQINDVHFVDASTGWVVGYNGTILKTTDGGSNWTSQKSEFTLILYDVFFNDASNGWVIGRNDIPGYLPLVYITSDGGESWRARQTGASSPLYSISFVSSSEGWVVGYNGTIRKTTTAEKAGRDKQAVLLIV